MDARDEHRHGERRLPAARASRAVTPRSSIDNQIALTLKVVRGLLDRGDRAGVRVLGGDGVAADPAREADDRGDEGGVRGARAPASSTRAWRRCSASSTRCSTKGTRPDRALDAARSPGRGAAARAPALRSAPARAGGVRAARADGVRRGARADARRRRGQSDPARRAGPIAVGRGAHSRRADGAASARARSEGGARTSCRRRSPRRT